ncbi:MAG: tRNA-dihydrouridine synthase, partial [bacterium]
EPSLRARIDVLIRHLRHVVEDKGELRGVREMRKQVGWYLKGFPTVKELRQIVNYLDTLDEVIAALETWVEALPADLIPLRRGARLDSGGLTVEDGKRIQQVSNLQ